MNITTPEALAEKFGEKVDRRKVIDWTSRYGWPHVKVGRTIAFTDADVEQILAMHHVDGTKGYEADRIAGQPALFDVTFPPANERGDER